MFLLLYHPSSVRSQCAYTVLFQNPSEEMPLDMVEDSTGIFYAVGYAGYDSKPWEFRGLAYRIASATDTMSRRISFQDTVTRFFKIISRSDQTFTILGTVSNPPDYHERLMVAFMDKNLNILSRKEYALKGYDRIDRMEYIMGRDNSIWLYGSIGNRPDPAMDFFMCKLNQEGDTIKTGYYYPYNPLAYSALFSPDSSMLWIFGSNYNFDGYGQRAVFDTSFNFISVKNIQSYVDPNMNTRWFTSGKILLGGNYVFFRTIQDDDIGISFIDTTLDNPEIHYFGALDTIDNPGAERFIDFITPSRIFFTGTHNLHFSFYPHGVSWIMTGLIDSSLNTIYQQFYGGDAEYYPFSLLATKDGGSMIAGRRFDYHTQDNEMDVIFLKYDSTGSITGTIPPEANQPYSFIVYPNPGQEYIQLTGNLEGLLFELYDQKGSLVRSTQLLNGANIIPTTDLQNGTIYIYQIKRNRQIIFTGKWIKK